MITLDEHPVFVGMGGWELPPFDKYFYPPRVRKGFRKLEFYSRYFDSVEINATFYNSAFTPDHARRWLDDVSGNEQFIFTVKLFRGFTHTFTATNDDVRSFRRLLEPLAQADKLGGVLMQFPTWFINTPDHRQYLRQFSRVFYPFRIFAEVRHASWNDPTISGFLTEHGLYPVNVDLPPVSQHMPWTEIAHNGVAYFRMMGRNLQNWNHPELGERYHYYYTEEELRELVRRVQKLREESNTIFVVFHNDPEANSLVNGFRLRHWLAQPTVAAPRKMVKAFPELQGIGSLAMEPLFVGEAVSSRLSGRPKAA